MTGLELPTRARRSEARRDELLDAADALFRERGVATTTVSDITRRAGVAKGTFYLYFDSKDHLVAGLHERLCVAMGEIAVASLERVGIEDFGELADALTASIIDYWIDHRETFLAISESGSSPETVQMLTEFDEQLIVMIEGGIRAGIEGGVADAPDPRAAAQFIFYGCQGRTLNALTSPGEIDRDELVSGSQAIIRKILSL